MDRTIKRLELAKTGQFGLDGAVVTLQDLREAVETFEGSPPVSIGHAMAKKDWFPQFGSILTVDLEEDEDGESGTLFGDVEMNEILAKAYDEGFYKSWSISIPARGSDGKKYIHHLAFLGAVPPKIRDLKVIKEMDREDSLDLSDCGTETTFYFYNSDFSAPSADTTLEEDDMEIKNKKPAEQKPAESKKEPEKAPIMEFSDEQKRLLDRSRKSYLQSARDRLKAAAGNLVPEDKMDALMEFSDSIAEVQDFDFSDGEKKVSKAPVEALIDIFKAIPKATGNLEKPFDFADEQASSGAQEDVDYSSMSANF